MNETYIAALEIGSSKITGAVGVYTPDKTLKVLAVEQEESLDSVRYGIIHNPDEVASRVIRIIDRLNANPAVAPRKITSVYVGLSGRSMRSVTSSVKLSGFPEETEITADMLKRLREDAAGIELDSNQEILAILPRSYQIDGMETTSPKGAMGKSIAAVFDVIIGRTEIKRNLLRALTERADVAVKDFIITQLAAANVVLSNEVKRLGCMLVDFGAETTSVSIYRKGELCYFATLPLGGRNITRDLTSLSILEEKAEEIKRESGRAVARENPSTLNVDGIKLSDVSNLVVARAEEIVANVIEQVKYAGLKKNDLPAGIVCIGAGAHLTGMLELLEIQSGLNARLGHLTPNFQTMEQRAKRHDNIQTLALLYAGAQRDKGDCLELPVRVEPEPETEPEKPEPARTDDGLGHKVRSFFGNVSSQFGKFFASPKDEEDDDNELN